jgi:hypothetical protein
MSYNTDHLRTAGKITVYTTLVGVATFAVIFISNLGGGQIAHVDAQSSATTTVRVVNTPPRWTATSTEFIESSATNPTNAGDTVAWIAIATDSNNENYHLLICDTSAVPATTTNGNAPSCSSGTQWAVSTSTISGQQAYAATTTLHSWAESNDWFAWICDTNATSSRCNATYTQGTNATNSSPFIVNHRPSYTSFTDNSPAEPGQAVTFTSVSVDSDTTGVQDGVKLFVCATAGFSTSTDSCTGTTLASTTAFVAANATATYTIVIPSQDQDYGAFGYVIDSHGFEATTTQGSDSTLTVSNSAPTVSGATISLVQASTTDIVLTVESGETTGFTLSFVTSDNNSCDAAGGGLGDEIIDYDLSIYRNGSGPITSSSSTCSVTGPYDPNNCYPSSVAPAAWNLSCTASTTSCVNSSDTDMIWNCTFPLWYVADPTDGTATSTEYSTNDWRAQVRAIDDGQNGNLVSLTGSTTQSDTGVNVTSFLAFALNTLSIPYGSLEPGQQTDPISATSTILATGNVGLDKDVQGSSMCTTYTNASPCLPSDTSTIPAEEQVYGTSTISYATAVSNGDILSSTTPQEIEINVPKSTSTSTATSSTAFWGIRIPGTITFAGDYTGQTTFTAIVGESVDW